MVKVHLKDEADLMRLGRMIGPDGKTAVPIEEPTDAWPDDKLLAYAKAKLGEAQQVEEEAISLGRRSPERHFWAGKAYTIPALASSPRPRRMPFDPSRRWIESGNCWFVGAGTAGRRRPWHGASQCWCCLSYRRGAAHDRH